jgi:hypothetical protein
MSGMKTFTVRQLDREPAVVLDAADREGIVQVKRRNGRVYSIQPEGRAKRIIALPDFSARRRAIFPRTIPASQARRVDQAIAGE